MCVRRGHARTESYDADHSSHHHSDGPRVKPSTQGRTTMKRATWYPVVFLLALIVLSFTQMLLVGATTSRVRHTIIAASGGAAPAGGNYSTFAFLNATLN